MEILGDFIFTQLIAHGDLMTYSYCVAILLIIILVLYLLQVLYESREKQLINNNCHASERKN